MPDCKVDLRVGATLFDTPSGRFIGRTCQPKGIRLAPQEGKAGAAAQSKTYRLTRDAVYEFYFFAAAGDSFNLVFDLWLERTCGKDGAPAVRKLLGWHFAPLRCLPAIRAQLAARGGAPQSNTFQVLKGSQRMMMNPKKTSFVPSDEQLVVTVDSEELPQQLQEDLNPLRSLLPMTALFSDDDSVPGIHCPLKHLTTAKRDEDS